MVILAVILGLVAGIMLASLGGIYAPLALAFGLVLYILADKGHIHLEMGLGLLMWTSIFGGIFGMMITLFS